MDDFLYQLHNKELDRFQLIFTEHVKDLKSTGNYPELEAHEFRARYYNLLSMYILANIPIQFVFDMCGEDAVDVVDKRVRGYDPFEKEISNKKGSKLYRDNLNAYIDKISSVVKTEGLSYFLFGLNDTGKTFTGLHLLMLAISEGMSGYYIPFFRNHKTLCDKVAYRDHTYAEAELVKYVTSCEFLVIDEIQKETASDSTRSCLEEIIKTRGEAKKPTVLITNMSFKSEKTLGGSKVVVDEFKESYGTSAHTSLRQRFKFLEFSSLESVDGKPSRVSYRDKFNSSWDKL